VRGNIYLWTGNGWGKTTSAIGAAIRAAGHGYKVVFIQFMKGRMTGEYKLLSKIKTIDIHLFGRKGWVNLKRPSVADKKRAQRGLEFAKQAAKKKPFLLVLDEINLAVAVGLLKENDVVDFLKSADKKVHIYLTGRRATSALKKTADFINSVDMKKGPKKLAGERGIDY